MEISKHLADTDLAFTQVMGNTVPLMVAQDLGSTETRTICFDLNANLSDILKVDSNYAVVFRDMSCVSARSKDLFSQLEMVVTDLTADQKAMPLFNTVRVIKGPLMHVINSHVTRTTANSSKIDQVPTFVNALTNIALMILLRAAEMGSMPSGVVPVDMTVSLPPEDTSTPVRVNMFSSRIAGEYSVEFVRLGCTVKFSIAEDAVHIFSESNAVAIAQQANSPINEGDTVAFIDVGGRSTGYSFVHNGVLLEDGCVTESIGGQKLKELIAQRASNMLNTQMPSDEVIMRALDTGKIRLGTKFMDISSAITESKHEIAEQIFNGFMLAMDRNDLQAQQITRVYCSGRTFGVSKDEEYVTSPSIMSILEELFKERAPYTEFSKVEVNDPIVTGLVYGRFMQA